MKSAVFPALFAAIVTTIGFCAAGISDDRATEANASIKGQRVFVCGHSFHLYIDKMLPPLAQEAGYGDHKSAGTFGLGNSRPLQHWMVPDEQNPAKRALMKGNIDVLTLSPNIQMPEEGIDLFADFAKKHNPDIRVMVQLSWSKETIRNPNADYWRQAGAAYLEAMRGQIEAINKKNGHEEVFLVPAGTALLIALDKIKEGKIPGLGNPAQLFHDSMCHPSAPLRNLVTYCWFGAVYHKSPVGLKALDSEETPHAMNLILQEIAWEALKQEPLSGVKAL